MRKKSQTLRIALSIIILTCSASGIRAQVSLAGDWRFALDRIDAGVRERWFTKDLTDRIKLPGILQAQGYGDEVSTRTPWVLSLYDRRWYLREDYQAYINDGAVKVPFLSQPPRHYLGAAWYQRDIDIPAEWASRRAVLTLERPHWETSVWVDEEKFGSLISLCVPHVYDLGYLTPGRHRLTIRVDNRMLLPYRPDSHSVSDSLGSSWNGIVGEVSISSTTPVWIDDAQIFPDLEKKSVSISVKIGNITGKTGAGTLSVDAGPNHMVTIPATWNADGGRVVATVSLGESAQTWDEFHPNIQQLRLVLKGDQADDSRVVSFGLRDLHAVGNQFLLNGKPINFRGTHNGGDFPLTGYPPTDVDSWRRIIRICKEWGLNHMRFHSWCPPEAAFVAADIEGFYLQPEPGMWNEISPGTLNEVMLYEETQRMIKAYGNHPSFMLLSASNEPKGRWQESLTKWIDHFRREDPRRLYTNGTGHTEREVPDLDKGTDYLAVQRIGPKLLRRESGWFGGDFRESLDGIKVPVISHEVGQWVAFPDFDIIKKFTGYLKPGNYEIFRDSMAAHHLLEKDKDFAWASGRYQLACYKEEIEANLRTPGLGGFQLLDLHDYLGQGSAFVGLLDAFWEPKSYAQPQEFRRFCNTVVPLARLQKRVLTTSDKLDIDLEVANFDDGTLEDAVSRWQILDSRGMVFAKGEGPGRDIPVGKNNYLLKVKLDASKLPAPRSYKLVVSLSGVSAGDHKRKSFENDWNFWVYPARTNISTPPDVLVTDEWEQAEAKLHEGGKVLYLPSNADLDWTSPPLDTLPVFWNRLMGPAWSRMLGLWNDTKHPALKQFPTEANFDWQWTELVKNARAINLDHLPAELQPIVWAIDDWNRNHKLALIFEARIGSGRLMVCSADLESSLPSRPAARQLRDSLLTYMSSEQFQPRVSLTSENMRSILFDTLIMRKLGAVANGVGDVGNIIDGDPNTYWLAGDPGPGPYQPRSFTLTFPKPVDAAGLVLMARQNHREHEGDIRGYTVEASDDGNVWREVVKGELSSSFEPKRIIFSSTTSLRYLRFTALSGFGGDRSVALAELAIIYAGPKLGDNQGGPLKYQRSRTATPEIDEGNAGQTPAKPKVRKPKPR